MNDIERPRSLDLIVEEKADSPQELSTPRGSLHYPLAATLSRYPRAFSALVLSLVGLWLVFGGVAPRAFGTPWVECAGGSVVIQPKSTTEYTFFITGKGEVLLGDTWNGSLNSCNIEGKDVTVQKGSHQNAPNVTFEGGAHTLSSLTVKDGSTLTHYGPTPYKELMYEDSFVAEAKSLTLNIPEGGKTLRVKHDDAVAINIDSVKYSQDGAGTLDIPITSGDHAISNLRYYENTGPAYLNILYLNKTDIEFDLVASNWNGANDIVMNFYHLDSGYTFAKFENFSNNEFFSDNLQGFFASPTFETISPPNMSAGQGVFTAAKTGTMPLRGLDLTVTGAVSINGSTIDVGGKGYVGPISSNVGAGPGAGTRQNDKGFSGGGHGGPGGSGGDDSWQNFANPGAPNDSEAFPIELGSAGGRDNITDTYGAGGGRVLITAGGAFTMDAAATLSANGRNAVVNDAVYKGGAPQGGGGAGGTLYISAATVTVSAPASGYSFSATGGKGGNNDTVPGGAGGGGRVALHAAQTPLTTLKALRSKINVVGGDLWGLSDLGGNAKRYSIFRGGEGTAYFYADTSASSQTTLYAIKKETFAEAARTTPKATFVSGQVAYVKITLVNPSGSVVSGATVQDQVFPGWTGFVPDTTGDCSDTEALAQQPPDQQGQTITAWSGSIPAEDLVLCYNITAP